MKFNKLLIATLLALAVAMPATAATKPKAKTVTTAIVFNPPVIVPAPAPEPKTVIICYDENGFPYLVWGATTCPVPETF